MTIRTARRVIAYQPPDWGQPLRPKSVRGACEAVQNFLDHCTDRGGDVSDATLTVYEPTRHTPPDFDPEPILAEVRSAFGPGQRLEAARMFPDTGYVEYKHEWRIPPAQFERALAILERVPRWSTKYFGPVDLSIAYEFYLRDPRTGEVLPNQGPEFTVGNWRPWSQVFLFLSNAPSASFDLRFPFEEPNSQFLDYLAAIRPYLPIKIAWNRFRLLVPNKRGTGYVARKIDPAVFQAPGLV